MNTIRRVAIIGGNRIPFARSNTVYSDVSNQEMLTATFQGLVDRFNLHGKRWGDVAAGAVMKMNTMARRILARASSSEMAAATPTRAIPIVVALVAACIRA